MARYLRDHRTAIVSTAFVAAIAFAAIRVSGIVRDMTVVATLHTAKAEHTDQAALLALVKAGDNDAAVEAAFEAGDGFFEMEFNALDGVGANVGDGSRFTRVPRADLTGPGQWASHTPPRATGPNAISCNACHVQLFDDGSGSAVGNVHRDPLHSGNIKQFIQRNTPHTLALGATQRLAEEMTVELLQDRDSVTRQACGFGSATGALNAKGISFGSIRAVRVSSFPCKVSYDTSRVAGVSADLIVRPFQWKGSVATIREFNRDAANNEIGMQAVEFTGDNVDGDGDGVVNEMTVGDVTALTIYLASQPRPTTKLELEKLGLIDPLTSTERSAIAAGAKVFAAAGCASCHVPRMTLNDPMFSEPSQLPQYRDKVFPAGQDPVSRGVDPRFPIRVDLTKDQPDNRVLDASGNVVYALGSLPSNGQGGAIVELFGDMRRHDMGARLAESIDEVGTGASVFLTRNLWGVGSTAPYLHDGRATTLAEAIIEHGGEAAGSRNAFLAQSHDDQAALIAFLDDLVLFKMSGNQVVIPPPTTVTMNSALTLKRRLR
ncbi:MAG TPA: di-heme oxidoredictase family protein [Vicinamibacterales bacterium]|nr:di-heme oxidoredictase family protein [Vicinamibacterales bacterium]